MRDKRTTKRIKPKGQKGSSGEKRYRGEGSGRDKHVREADPKGRTDWYRLRAMTDEEAERNASRDPDNRPADLGWLSAGHLVQPPQKEPISLRLDSDVLAWFRATGTKYQTRMNEVLKAYVQHQRKNETTTSSRRSR